MKSLLALRFKEIVLKLKQYNEIKNQTQLADLYGVSKQQMTKYVNGHSAPPFELLQLLYDKFNVDMNYLFDVRVPIFKGNKDTDSIQNSLLGEPSVTYGNDKTEIVKSLRNQLDAKDETIQTQKILIDNLMGNMKAKAS